MSKIQIRILDQQPELEVAITEFIKEEFNEQATFTKEPANNDALKGDVANIAW